MLYHFGSNWVIIATKDCFRKSWANSNYDQRRTCIIKLCWNSIKLSNLFIEDDECYVEDKLEVEPRLRASLHQVQNYLSGRGVKSIIELINFNGRSLAKAVLGYSTLHQADLIMIMTQQENNFTQYLIGSSAQSII